MAITLAEQSAASVTTPASGESSIYFDSTSSALSFKDDAAAVHTLLETSAAGIAATIVDAKGDLIAATAADTVARLAVGTNGQVLTAASGETTGLKWDTPWISTADAGNSSTADTIDWSLGASQKSTLTGNCTYTFSNPVAGGTYVLRVHQDATGSRTVTWPGTVHWSGGTTPTLTTTASKVDIFTFHYDGSTYFGVTSGLNYTA